MPLNIPDDTCLRDAPSAACAAHDIAESVDIPELSRRAKSAATCSRLFENQQVMQNACVASCRSSSAGDGQECAFAYSRSLHEVVTADTRDAGMTTVLFGLVGALVCGACWAVLRGRRKTQPG